MSSKELLLRLDLDGYIASFKSFLARDKELFLEGDSHLHFKRINELSQLDFPPPPQLKNLDTSLSHLSKQGVLHLDELFEWVKIWRYFSLLKKLKCEGALKTWLDKIEFPATLLEIVTFFDEKGELKEDLDERLLGLNLSLKMKKESIEGEFRKYLHAKNLTPFLIDTQIHLVGNTQTLLLRGGFASTLKARIVSRSSGGGFYVLPLSIETLELELEQLREQKEQIYYEYAQKFSAILHKNLLFLKFINRAFDVFDHYAARVWFAKKNDYEFILCDGGRDIILRDFAHPGIKNPKSINLDFNQQVLIITGVNAGGKSMLLKSVLSAAFLAKHLLPMKINAAKSKIGAFKELELILEDPQNVKNNLSTFAGRMLAFSGLFTRKNLLLGVDEIELGTDFEEAACLYSVLVEKLLEKGHKIIITTHHKRLALLLAQNPAVELLAALYDEENARPKYEFLKGTIGKSYAFETALRYGVGANFVEEARKIYGEDKQNLEQMVGKNIELELELKMKLEKVTLKEQKVEQLLQRLGEQKERHEEDFRALRSKLELEFYQAINEAKKGLNLTDFKDKQRSLNRANELKNNITPQPMTQKEEFYVKDFVKYGNIKGQIIALNKNEATIESEGLKLRLPLGLLKKISLQQKPSVKKTTLHLARPTNLATSLDLHGLRSDEAIERLDKFISDALLAGLDEILVYHGIGTGKLAFAVREFLKEHKSVRSFEDAPINQGGFGAKVVKF